MKKILLLVLPLMVMCFASSCNKEEWTDNSSIIQFKDPYFQQALLNGETTCSIIDSYGNYVLYDIDRDNDGQISEKEASMVARIDVHDNGLIQDMSEISYFTMLEDLACYGNQLTSLNVSNNTRLKSLNCSNNLLTELTIGENLNLERLTCEGNKITSIDLRYCLKLNYLWIVDNQLTSLNLSNNTNLTDIICSNNMLTTIDISNCINLSQFQCQNNYISVLDLRNNKSLKYLVCSNNPLTKIIIPQHNFIDYDYMKRIEQEYGDVIEYAE